MPVPHITLNSGTFDRVLKSIPKGAQMGTKFDIAPDQDKNSPIEAATVVADRKGNPTLKFSRNSFKNDEPLARLTGIRREQFLKALNESQA